MLEARDLHIALGGRLLFEGFDFSLRRGGITGLFGPSGRGKTTLGRILAGHCRPASGAISKARVQYLHQNPIEAMNPRWPVARILAEAGEVDGALAQNLGVSQDWSGRFPHELSVGQLARVALLRALLARPEFLIADEISAALDPLAQVALWRVVQGLCQSRDLGVLAISHDRALLQQIADFGIISL